jgi:hypothetical protein
MFSSHRIRAGILVVVLDTTSHVPLPSKLPVGQAMRSFLVFGTLCIYNCCTGWTVEGSGFDSWQGKRFFSSKHPETGCGAHPVSYPMVPGIKMTRI